MALIDKEIFSKLPPALVANIVSYKVETTADLANLRLVSRKFGRMLLAVLGSWRWEGSYGRMLLAVLGSWKWEGSYIRCPSRRTGGDTFIHHLLNYDKGYVFEEFGVFPGDIHTEHDMSLLWVKAFQGAGVQKIQFIGKPFRSDRLPPFKIQSVKDLPVGKLQRTCQAIEQIQSLRELERLGNKVAKWNMLDPVQGNRDSEHCRFNKDEDEDFDIFPMLLVLLVPKNAPCITKQSSDGKWLELVSIAESEADDRCFLVPVEKGCKYRAPLVSSKSDNEEFYLVHVLMNMVSASSRVRRNLLVRGSPASECRLPFSEAWNTFQKNESLVEGVAIVDDFIGSNLQDALNDQINNLAARQEKDNAVDYHPHSDNIIRDLVHPGLYSYIKDTSPLRGVVADVPPCIFRAVVADQMEEGKDFWGRPYEDSLYQWLPTYFSIAPNGSCVIEDYINNLAPRDDPIHAPMYASLARLFEHCLPFIESVYSYVRAVRPKLSGGRIVTTPLWQLWHFGDQYCSLRGQKLQVITKIVDYELSPGQSFTGVWHVDGMSHEEIVLTALYIIDRDEELDGAAIEYKRAFCNDEASLLVSKVSRIRPNTLNRLLEEGLMPLGKVATRKGRLIVFPNSHVHKVDEMVNTSQDQSGVAKRRIIVFFLVNPLRRIVSTREVAPQQVHCGGTMDHADALEHRLQLMRERKHTKQDWNVREIELLRYR